MIHFKMAKRLPLSQNRSVAVLIGLFFLLFGLEACKKDKPEPAGTNPVISGIQPLSGPKETTVTISGSGFGDDVTRVTVYVNSRKAAITSFSSSEIEIRVPPGAGSGAVTVTVNGNSATGPVFNFIYTITVTTLTGQPGIPGYINGPPSSAQFNFPRGLTIDALGNLYVCDEKNQRIRKISASGDVVTFVGSGIAGHQDGIAFNARFNSPFDIDLDEINGYFYVADKLNHCIRRISLTGDVTTAAGIPGSPGYVDAPGQSARLNSPTGVALEGEDVNVYIADGGNHCIRKLDPFGVLSTFAGSTIDGQQDGTGTGAKFSAPFDISWDTSGFLLVTDKVNQNIRRINKYTSEVYTIAGTGIAGYQDGHGSNAHFNSPSGVTGVNGFVVVCDQLNQRIRTISPALEVATVAGDGTAAFADGDGSTARFNNPGGIVQNKSGDFFICDTENHCIRKMVID